jgi:hypothetical protein
MKTKNLLTILVILFLTSFAWGQVPQTMSYQGLLSDDGGVPVPDGNYNVTFRLYEVASGGSPIWEEAQLIAVSDGIFNAILGSVVPLNLPFDDQYWLGVTVGAGSELSPRIELSSSAYSLNSANSEKAGGFEVSPTPAANTLLPLDGSGKFPAGVLPQIPSVNIDGVKASDDITINSTSNFELLSFTINTSGTLDVSVSAHLVAEISGDGSGRYEFNITRGSVNGTSIGRGWWRPGTSGGFQAITISFSGVDTDVSGPVTYYLVGRKYDSGAKDALVFIEGLSAIWIK